MLCRQPHGFENGGYSQVCHQEQAPYSKYANLIPGLNCLLNSHADKEFDAELL